MAVTVFPPICSVLRLLGLTTSYVGFSFSHVLRFDVVGASVP